MRVRLATTKTDAEAREVPLDPQVVALLDSYIHDSRGGAEGPLFLNARGEPLTFWSFAEIYSRLRNRLREKGIDGFMA